MNMNNDNRKPCILLSRNWIESSISDDIDKLEKQLNDILDKLTDDEKAVIRKSLSHEYHVGCLDISDEFNEV